MGHTGRTNAGAWPNARGDSSLGARWDPASGARCRRGLAALLIAALPAVMFINVWRVGGVATLADDLIYYLPVRAYIGQQLRSGHLPLWNPYVAMGAPLAADPQAGLWYPFTWLFVMLPPLAAYSLTLWAHFVLAGWGMYRFLRGLGRVWPAALLGALAFEFCPYLIAHREHLTILEAVAWMPWMFWAWQRYAGQSRKSKVESRNQAGSAVSSQQSAVNPFRFALIGCAFWGLQLLVQHIQPSIMTAALLGAYVIFVLRRQRATIVWVWMLATVGGAVLSAVQFLPSYYLFGRSGRGAAAYYLFIENSWVLSSALIFLFPMLYGNSGSSLWSERWWGISHLSEQWAYPSLVIVVLAIASLAFLRMGTDSEVTRAGGDGDRPGGREYAESRRVEVIFWWGASLIALLIALGDATPLSKLLFHIPVYRNLRAPARWILVWSLAAPVMASLVLDAILRGGALGDRAGKAVHMTISRVAPVLVLVSLLFMGAGFRLAMHFSNLRYNQDVLAFLTHLRGALRWNNTAILWPILIMILTAGALRHWQRIRSGKALILLFAVFMLDIASLAPFVAIDTRTYSAGEILHKPPLATAIEASESARAGERLLVPRIYASYERPLEVLWPQGNLIHHISTLNGYGPLGDAASRLLLPFMPWGSSWEIIGMLRNRPLLERLGLRFLAVRSQEERAVLAAAMLPEVDSIAWQKLTPPHGRLQAVHWEKGILWPVRVERTGLYALELEAVPAPRSPSRWFVGLERPDHQELAISHPIEPADLSCGARHMRLIFDVPEPAGAAFVRVKSEIWQALWVRQARFGLIAAPLAGSSSARKQPSATGVGYRHIAHVAQDIDLYELPGAQPLLWSPRRVHGASNMSEAIDWLTGPEGIAAGNDAAVVEGTLPTSAPSDAEDKGLTIRPRVGDRPEEVAVEIRADSAHLMVLNASYNPGWTATIDGASVPVLRVNAVTQGVWTPAGEHVLRFEYCQPGLATGALVSLVAWVALIVLLTKTHLRPGDRIPIAAERAA